MKKIGLIIFCFFGYHISFAQTNYYTIQGKIIDAVTKVPMPAASVFAQNTTLGTATNDEGNFKLYLPTGGYDLVITFSGYQTQTKRISATDADDKNIVIELSKKEKALEDVVIKSSNEVKDGWEKYGNFFIDNFLGTTSNSKLCKIKNPSILKFYFSKKRNRLKVLADEPLQIENAALGYTIKYALDSFTHEYNTQITTHTGYPLFEEMNAVDTMQKNIWATNRTAAYNGSTLHFMRSLYHKKLKEESFEIQYLVKINGVENAINLKDYYAATNYKKDDSTQTVTINPNQQQVAVLYNNELPQKDYLLINADEPTKFQLSLLFFLANTPLTIEANGYYYEQNDITINGYWEWEKVGDMLPYDYLVK
jgi:CarboxypepD_reg-like domain